MAGPGASLLRLKDFLWKSWHFYHLFRIASLKKVNILIFFVSIKYCHLGVPVTVTGVAEVKIMTEDENYLAIACEQFLGKSDDEIKELLLGTFEGHLRAIVGTMDVEELFQDREEFARNVREVAATDVSKEKFSDFKNDKKFCWYKFLKHFWLLFNTKTSARWE